MADRIGQELGNYRLVSLLGRGGFAEVYLGEHMRLKTKTAIKVLYTQLEGDDTEYFLTEAQTVAHLIHPHIVRIFDFDVKEGVPFLVMDYAPNGNLRQRHPKNTRIPLETIVSYIKQVADALQYAHDGKLIHRDIKPENMLLGRRNEVLLSDFGIALIAQSTRMQSTQEVVGTAYYMAPEQLQGKPRLASDQYALGIVVYEWLSGSRPFHGSFSEIASQHMFVPPKPLREKIPTISPVVEEVVMTALAKDPHQRFGSVQAFANALEQASQSTRTSSTITPPSQPLVQPGSATSSSQPLIQTGQQPIILQSGPITSPNQSRSQPITPPPVSRPGPPVRKQAEVVSSNTNPSSQTPVAPARQSAARPNSAMPLNRPSSQPGPSTPPRPSGLPVSFIRNRPTYQITSGSGAEAIDSRSAALSIITAKKQKNDLLVSQMPPR
jgi:serine/threonine protein kinase